MYDDQAKAERYYELKAQESGIISAISHLTSERNSVQRQLDSLNKQKAELQKHRQQHNPYL